MTSEKLSAGLKTNSHNADWNTIRFKFLFKKVKRGFDDGDEIVTAFRDGQVTLRINRRNSGFTFADKEIGYQGVQQNDLVIHAMDGFAGAIGISDSAGKCSPVYSIAVPISKDLVYPKFWGYYLRNLAISGFIESLAKGIRERSTDFRWYDVGDLLVNYPELVEQREVADFLDDELLRINSLIQKIEDFSKLTTLKIEAVMHNAISSPSIIWKRFENITSVVKRKVERKNDVIYRPIGLLNRGRGLFTKLATLGEDLGDSTFNLIEESDLILSGQFAWEGAVALASEDDAGKIASHRFPMFIGKEGINTSYLYSYFRTHRGRFLLENCSRGAAGRNKPLSVGRLNKVKIPIPPIETQNEIAKLIDKEIVLKIKLMKILETLKQLKISLITEAITGQLNINEWQNKNESSDKISDII